MTTQIRTSKADLFIYSELAIASASVTITCIWQRLKGRQWTGKAL